MIKVNLFFINDSQDVERFLSDSRIRAFFQSGLIKADWGDNEGTALFVDRDVLSQLEKIAVMYELLMEVEK